jgi:hypothetical protein
LSALPLFRLFCGTLLGRKCCTSFCSHFQARHAQIWRNQLHPVITYLPPSRLRLRAANSRLEHPLNARFHRKLFMHFHAKTTQPTLWCPFPLSYFSHPFPHCLAPALHLGMLYLSGLLLKSFHFVPALWEDYKE